VLLCRYEGMREQQVAAEHADSVSPHDPSGVVTAALGALVDHIVMQQGRRVDQLYTHGHLAAGRRNRPEARRREQQRHGPNALSPQLDQMTRRIRSRGGTLRCALSEGLLHPPEIVAQEGLSLRQTGYEGQVGCRRGGAL
jgi:hypothetical protein